MNSLVQMILLVSRRSVGIESANPAMLQSPAVMKTWFEAQTRKLHRPVKAKPSPLGKLFHREVKLHRPRQGPF